jgi:uncharacterized protein YcaQ
MPIISAREARLLLLGAQGLLDRPDRRATASALYNLIERMGFVQIDTINVVERAHHLTLASRLDGYRHAMLARLLENDRLLFEHWTHDASAIPTKWFAHWWTRFETSRGRIEANAWWKQRMGDNARTIIDEVLRRIERDGPLLSRDFEHAREEGEPVENGWWGWKPQKAALEYLWRTGALMVARRVNFQKVYDLTSRVLPEHHRLPRAEEQERIEWACSSALERLGVATPSELAAFWRAIDIPSARRWCERACQEGRIVEVMVEAADRSQPRKAFAEVDWERRLRDRDEAPQRIRLLSPFDPVLRDRTRTQRVFNFDYRFEGFVPAAKRHFGYYVLPMLEADQLIGRVDPKFDRQRGELVIRRMWWEPGIRKTRARRRELEAALDRLASFIGAERLSFSGR